MRRSATALLAALGGAALIPLGATAAAADPGAAPAPAPAVQPLPQAHAHNDYEHERPLLDALDHGFTSVEADVYLVDGQLLVAHDPWDLDPARTLQSLYLDPLAWFTEHHRGSVFGDGRPVQLLIDIKTEAVSTYAAIDEALAWYDARDPWMLTTYTMTDEGYDAAPGAVSAVVSGNRPLDLIARQPVRNAAYDGRSGDLASGADPDFMPLVSDNWNNLFTWKGVGEMPEAERTRLHEFVRAAHLAGRQVRFWATPDEPGPEREAVWRELVAAHVDHVNTDDLAGLRGFLLALPQQPAA
ncbi:phosphatidylinositol-specific phospholipase C/glycerophosphodiester phosphodiesterase family protein [Kineococcus sp. SYSU DK005]|uniref:phosphatidylinositol-specific phospholipase C/glycerophosphodiester phosphodiesterase family protein n=1 Tax=Kineococcus sp. SYSU DK005 TaxID=3383126 RepID=UPI003D7DD9B1